jgi:hypothetical protein
MARISRITVHDLFPDLKNVPILEPIWKADMGEHSGPRHAPLSLKVWMCGGLRACKKEGFKEWS